MSSSMSCPRVTARYVVLLLSLMDNEKLPSGLIGIVALIIAPEPFLYLAYNVFAYVGILNGRLEVSAYTGIVASFSSSLHASSKKNETIVGVGIVDDTVVSLT